MCLYADVQLCQSNNMIWLWYDMKLKLYVHDVVYYTKPKLDAGMWRYHANRMDARRSQFDLGRVDAYI